MLPDSLIHAIEAAPTQAGKPPLRVLAPEAVGGGCIHHAQRLTTSEGNYFLKYNQAGELPNFQAEYAGLTLLRKLAPMRVPRPLYTGVSAGPGPMAFFLMEHIPGGGKSRSFWTDLGQGLATLHRQTAPDFGLDHDNFIGRLPQKNDRRASWIDFFVEMRLAPQLALATDRGLAGASLQASFERLYQKLPELLPEAPPSFLHGDLWSGNFMVDAQGQPVLIDPAVYYGHREAEIAFTQLFGGFDPEFYAAYNATWPLTPGWRSRVDLFNLYPLAVHLNLFGRSYLPEIQSILRKFT